MLIWSAFLLPWLYFFIYYRFNPQVVNKHQGRKTKVIKGLYHYLHKCYKTEQRKFMRQTFGQYPFSVTRFFERRCSSLILETKTASLAAARLLPIIYVKQVRATCGVVLPTHSRRQKLPYKCVIVTSLGIFFVPAYFCRWTVVGCQKHIFVDKVFEMKYLSNIKCALLFFPHFLIY